VFAVGASLVQVVNPSSDADVTERRNRTEKVTRRLDQPAG
jgi:hypothetical protein